MAAVTKRIHVIGFGSVGQALHRMLIKAGESNKLGVIASVSFFAPEIKEKKTEGIFTFNPCPAVERDTLIPVLDLIAGKPGDILLELATRIDTITIWKEAKARGLHFINSGFDCWGDVELDLENLVRDVWVSVEAATINILRTRYPRSTGPAQEGRDVLCGQGPYGDFFHGYEPGVHQSLRAVWPASRYGPD
jgi:homospermidine synthase